MKKFLCLALVFGIFSLGCKKHASPPPAVYPSGSGALVPCENVWLLSHVIGAGSVLVTDDTYELVPSDKWEDYFPPDDTLYQTNRYDCDDFAIVALARARAHHNRTSTNHAGISIGIIGFSPFPGSPEGHAANIMILDDGTVQVYDPQSRKAYPGVPAEIHFIIW